MNSSNHRTQSVGTKVTVEDERRIKQFCEARNSDVSTLTRQLWLDKLDADSPASELFLTGYLVELAEKTLEALIETNGKEYVARFRSSFEQNAAALLAARMNRITRP